MVLVFYRPPASTDVCWVLENDGAAVTLILLSNESISSLVVTVNNAMQDGKEGNIFYKEEYLLSPQEYTIGSIVACRTKHVASIHVSSENSFLSVLLFLQWQTSADSPPKMQYSSCVTCRRSSDPTSSSSPTLSVMQPDCSRLVTSTTAVPVIKYLPF